MSPYSTAVGSMLIGFPRVSGDEPIVLRFPKVAKEFSPRERG